VSLRQQRKSLFDALLYKKHRALYRQRFRRWPPLDYYAMVLALLATVTAGVAGAGAILLLAVLVWAVLLLRFLNRRLWGSSVAPRHVAEVLIASLLIPPLSVFWRLYGAVKFRATFF
jgi:hypothetical protein